MPKDICRVGEASDPSGDAVAIDVAAAAAGTDCATGEWVVAFETYDAWGLDEMFFIAVLLDTDGNIANGCDGFDFAVGGVPGDADVLQIPSCEADWPLTGAVGIEQSDPHVGGIIWPGAAIGSPTGPVELFMGVENIYEERIEFVPDAGEIVVGGGSSPPTVAQSQEFVSTYGGVSRGTMMVGFSESPEFRSRTGLA